MSVVCVRCSNTYEANGPCPRCGAERPTGQADKGGGGPRWQQTTTGRVVVGMILAQGLFYGLRYLLTGLLLAVRGGEPDDLWHGVTPLLLLQGVQLFAVVAGGVLAGGGHPQALMVGALVGVWNGVASVLLRQNPAQEVNAVALYGQPLLQAFVAALGGWLGGRIWPPVPDGALPVLLTKRKPTRRRRGSVFAGKVHWFRIAFGAACAIAGTLSATLVFQGVLDASAGRLGTTHELQDEIITWEIKALAVLLGGALAGACTSNGLKQGLFVGLAGSVVLVGLQTAKHGAWAQLTLTTLVSTFSLAATGGWFGGTLFPPVLKLSRRGMDSTAFT
jgi:hypothetical protein